MKKYFLIGLLWFPTMMFAQAFGSLSIFSEKGDKFYLLLDGVKQNDIPQNRVRIEGLPDLYYSAKIVFEDPAQAPILKNNLYVSDGEDVMRDATYRIRSAKGEKPRLIFYSMVPVQKNFVPSKGTFVYQFGQSSHSEEKVAAVDSTIFAPMSALGNVHFFSANGDKFFVYLDGIKQNEVAQSNVQIRGVTKLFYNAKIVFKDSKFAPIVKNNLAVSDADDVLMDAAYRIRRDNAGKPRVNFYSMKPVQQQASAPTGVFVVNFISPAPGTIAAASTSDIKKATASTKGYITNIKVTDAVDPKKSAGKPAANNKQASSTATVAKPVAVDPALAKTKTVTVSEKPAESQLKKEPESKKCSGWPMGKGDLTAAKKAIAEAGKEDAKLEVAQQLISSNCLSTSQVIEFCNMFGSEKYKLAFAKYAYKFTLDRKNYADVGKIFTSESSRKELTKFINAGK